MYFAGLLVSMLSASGSCCGLRGSKQRQVPNIAGKVPTPGSPGSGKVSEQHKMHRPMVGKNLDICADGIRWVAISPPTANSQALARVEKNAVCWSVSSQYASDEKASNSTHFVGDRLRQR